MSGLVDLLPQPAVHGPLPVVSMPAPSPHCSSPYPAGPVASTMLIDDQSAPGGIVPSCTSARSLSSVLPSKLGCTVIFVTGIRISDPSDGSVGPLLTTTCM